MKHIEKLVFLLSFVFFIFFVVSPILKVNGYTGSPGTGNFGPNLNQTVNILASGVPTGATVVALRITYSGVGGIVNFTHSSSFGLAIPCAGGGNEFNTTTVCVDLGKTSGTIVNGEVIGTLVISSPVAGTVTLLAGSGGAYVAGSTVVNVGGTIGSYNVISGLTTTNLEDFNWVMIFGSILIIIGFLTLKYIKKNNKF